jgi:hypothetical protein
LSHTTSHVLSFIYIYTFTNLSKQHKFVLYGYEDKLQRLGKTVNAMRYGTIRRSPRQTSPAKTKKLDLPQPEIQAAGYRYNHDI